jgi:hypothetical protein
MPGWTVAMRPPTPFTQFLRPRQDGRPETVESLGGGWTAEEALAIALYACLRGSGLDECLRIAVTHGGDSDSTGAIAGNMLGVMIPDAVLSHPWATVIQGADIIGRLARDHARLLRHPDAADALFEFYPGGVAPTRAPSTHSD